MTSAMFSIRNAIKPTAAALTGFALGLTLVSGLVTTLDPSITLPSSLTHAYLSLHDSDRSNTVCHVVTKPGFHPLNPFTMVCQSPNTPTTFVPSASDESEYTYL